MIRCHPPTTIAKRSMMLCIVLMITSCLLPAALGQSTSATLSGTVEDQDGAVIPGVNITIKNADTGIQRETTTNADGSFSVPLLPPGKYIVRARRDGFAPVDFPNVVLNVGDQKALQIQLKAGDVNAIVQVTSEAPLINESPVVGTTVDRQFVENIPLNGRSFQSLITLTPGVVVTPSSTNFTGQFSVNGQRASANAFIIDGVSANFGASPGAGPGAQASGNLPGLTTFGTTQSLVAVDALQEFKIQTSTYAAEYGRQPGGQISIVTRSGTNDFHGSLFDYLRNDKFDANDWFANANRTARPPERQNDFGGTFSGPVLFPRFGEGGKQPWYNGRNRTFFFFSYEGLRLRLPKFALTNVPTLCLRGRGSCLTGQNAAPLAVQSLLNAFPLPNGRDLGNGLAEFSASYSDQSSLDATSIRIDHNISSKLTLFGRYNQSPSSSETRSTSNLNVITSSRIGTKTLTLGLTGSLTPHLLGEFRVNYSDDAAQASTRQDSFRGATPVDRSVLVPAQYDSPHAQGNAQFPFTGRSVTTIPFVAFVDSIVTSQRQFNLVANVSYGVRAHQVKFGMDIRRLTPTNETNSYVNIPQFRSMQEVLNSSAGVATIIAGLNFKPIYLNFSLYGQDTWRVSSRITLDLGVRWEVNPPPGEANGNLPLAVTQIDNLSTMQLAARGTKLWRTTYNNFAPRLGVSYHLIQHPGRDTIVRGGFGVYYDTGNDLSSSPFTSFPFAANRPVTNEAFPLNPTQVAPPVLPIQTALTAPYPFFESFDPTLRLPYTLQWNTAVEQSIGQNQVLTLSYVGAAGRRLLQRRQWNLSTINPSFTTVTLTANNATSDYHALQAQFQRRLSRGLQTVASYTWSHAIDEDSTSSTNRPAQRGNANFDVRHIFAAAVTYDIPVLSQSKAVRAVSRDWSIDTAIHAQTALPVDIVARTFTDPATGILVNVRPTLLSGVPLYLDDPTSPGGRKINRAAFSIPAVGQSGNLGRNVVRGLPAWQVDLALNRRIKLTEKLSLQLRGEAFNVFNHPNFGTIQTTLTATNFGQATNMLNRQLGGLSQLYQIGGPRSFQFALKLQY